jgi:hypothetical protein
MENEQQQAGSELSYDELVHLANDPTISNDEREVYRARLKALFGARLREGLGFASRKVTPAAHRAIAATAAAPTSDR